MKLYRTRTQEGYDWLMKKLEDEGYEWSGGTKPTENEDGREYANEVVIYLEANKRLTWDFVKDVDGKNISRIIEVSELMAEPDPLAAKIEERNSKPMIIFDEFDGNDPIQPQHYKTGGKDLFDEWYDRYYHSKKMFTGREVFIIIMKVIAERYTRRYPNKNDEDLKKGIETLNRLKEYEEMEK